MVTDSLRLSLNQMQGSELQLRYGIGIEVTVGRLTFDYAKTPHAEITIDVDERIAPELSKRRIFQGRVGLLSRSGVDGCVRTCKRRIPTGVPWDDLIDDICQRRLARRKSPIRPQGVGLEPPKRDRPMYQVWPLLPSRQPTILYGQGGVGKSWIAAYLCALVDHGITCNGLNADVGRALYLDWETDHETISGRVWAIKGGEPQFSPDWTLAYQRMDGPLIDVADDLAGIVSQDAYDLIVVDSVGLALGGDANSVEDVLAFFAALRQIEATTLLIDHMTKGPDAKERGAFGSVYKRNTARSVWEIRQAESELTVGLYHRKANNSRLFDPLGLKLSIFEDDNHVVQSATFARTDASDLPDLEGGMTTPQRIKALLRDGEASLEYLREGMADVKTGTIDVALSRLVANSQVNRLQSGRYGLAHRE